MKKHMRLLLFLTFFCSFLALTAEASARTSKTKGIDVSAYNGQVDWELVASQGYTFAMIRIAEGQAPDVDKYFEENYEGAKAAGLKVGVYHDCCIRTPEDAALEAQYCLELLDGRELDYPVAYDMEKAGTFAGGIDNTTEIAKTYCDIIVEGGYTPMIYSFASRLNQDFDWDELEGIKIWVAHHGADEPDASMTYDLWQYTANGDVDGANTDQGVCDINYSFMEAESIRISASSLTLGVKESITAAYTLTPLGCTDTVKWSSSDKSIVKVSQKGKITALKKGTATITAVTGSKERAEITITVKKAPTSVKLQKSSKTLAKGKTYALKPSLPQNSASNKMTYTSSNKSIAAVNSKGVIKAKKKGSAVITIKTFNGKTASIKITVK